MTKAQLTLPNGTNIHIEGSPDEVKALLDLYSSQSNSSHKTLKPIKTTKSGEKKAPRKGGPADLIRELIAENYFKAQKRSLSDIQKKLEEGGHIYAQTSLSTPLTRLTRAKELRRIKEQKGWMYVI